MASHDPVTVVRTTPTPTAVIAETTTWDAFPALWPDLLDEVWAFVRRGELDPGRNVMLYRGDPPHVEVGVEVGRRFAAGDRVIPSSLPAGRAARTIARGAPSREGLARAHEAVHTWCGANRHELSGTRWEVYGHWRDEQDPAEYEVEVYWLLRAQ